ncbi:MAG TPA: TlpA family protein disulfide reductase [Nitrospirae bacterium]|nr:TlpA family protein disulfide reductase [Nitrospirota bacterium]
MPSLENLHQRFKGKPFALLAIDLQEKRETVLRYVRKHGLTYTNLLDENGQVSALYGVSSTPVKFLIDTEGYMVGAALGYRDWDKDEIISLIELLLKPSLNGSIADVAS